MRVFRYALTMAVRKPLFFLIYAVGLSFMGVAMALAVASSQPADTAAAVARPQVDWAVVDRDGHGLMRLRYAPGYDGVPLSVRLPVRTPPYLEKDLKPFLAGLLPDDRGGQGRPRARARGSAPETSWGSCPSWEGTARRPSPSSAWARTRFRGRPTTSRSTRAFWDSVSPSSWTGARRPGRRGRSTGPSGGGFQPKIALACFDGRWYSCEGDAATTHILKPGIKGRAFQSLVEHVTMRACALMGVEVANTEYLDGLGAVCIERFDRVVRRPFDVVRIHQEDFCQACGILPENKYTENGGPVAPDIAAAIDRFIDDPDTDKKAFFLMVVANHLLGAPDGHAKNFSLLEYPDGGVRLAPMYDCASGLPYDGPRDRRVAMGIGGVSAVGRLGIGAVTRMAKACDLNGDWCVAKVSDLSKGLPDAVATALNEVSGVSGAEELRIRLLDPVAFVCEATLARLR